MLNVSFTLEFLILLIFYINFLICQGLIYIFSNLVTFVIWSLLCGVNFLLSAGKSHYHYLLHWFPLRQIIYQFVELTDFLYQWVFNRFHRHPANFTGHEVRFRIP